MEWFDRVIAADVSEKQIGEAPRHPRVVWKVEAAEHTTIAARSVDLVAVATALHWFDHDRFYAEVRRVAASGGAIAAWVYTLGRMDGEAGAILRRFALETLRDYWPAERRHVDERYRNVSFPFERIAAPEMSIVEHWTLEQLAGYARTWSSSARYRQQHGVDAVAALEAEMKEVWGPAATRRIEWRLVVLAGSVS